MTHKTRGMIISTEMALVLIITTLVAGVALFALGQSVFKQANSAKKTVKLYYVEARLLSDVTNSANKYVEASVELGNMGNRMVTITQVCITYVVSNTPYTHCAYPYITINPGEVREFSVTIGPYTDMSNLYDGAPVVVSVTAYGVGTISQAVTLAAPS